MRLKQSQGQSQDLNLRRLLPFCTPCAVSVPPPLQGPPRLSPGRSRSGPPAVTSSQACSDGTSPKLPALPTGALWSRSRVSGKSPDETELGRNRRTTDDLGRSPEKGPLAVELALPPSKQFLVRNGAPSPGNQDKSTTHSSGLHDSDSTSHSLLLCVFLNVCARACACQCVKVSAVCEFMCACMDRNPLTHMPELCPSVKSVSRPSLDHCHDPEGQREPKDEQFCVLRWCAVSIGIPLC